MKIKIVETFPSFKECGCVVYQVEGTKGLFMSGDTLENFTLETAFDGSSSCWVIVDKDGKAHLTTDENEYFNSKFRM